MPWTHPPSNARSSRRAASSAVALGLSPATSPLDALLQELPLATQALGHARTCFLKHKLHAQLSILSVWPCLIQHIWRTMYPAKDLEWSPKKSIEEQKALWARATPKTRVDDVMEDYYRLLVTRTMVLAIKVQNGLHADKEGFEAYLTNLLDTWGILARLAVYHSLIGYNEPLVSLSDNDNEALVSLLDKEDSPLFKAWNGMSFHICEWNAKRGKKSQRLSLQGLFTSRKGQVLQYPPRGGLHRFHNAKSSEKF